MADPRSSRREDSADYEPGSPRKGPIGARTARDSLADSMQPERLPDRPTPQTAAGKQRVGELGSVLTTQQAERVVDEVRRRYSLDDAYIRNISECPDGSWMLSGPDGTQTVVAAMDAVDLKAWLQREHFAEAIGNRDTLVR